MVFEFPNIDPVAVSLGPFNIRWYALAYLVGFLLGWKYALSLAKLDTQKKPTSMDIDDFLPWAVIAVILGGRLGYALFYNFDYYAADPALILKVWQGGMAFHGGALGVMASMMLYARWKGFSFLPLADIVVCAVPIGLFFGRIANFINGELYGRVTDVPWAFVFPRGGDMPRHPSQLYEAALEGLALFIVLALLVRNGRIRNKPGFLGGVFLVGYGLSRGFVEFFREPDGHLGFIFWDISMGQILSAPMVIAGLLVIAWSATRKTGA